MGNETMAVIMAAGEGTRMKSAKPKVLHEVCGYPIIDYVVDAVREASGSSPVLIVGHGAQEIRNHLQERVRYVHQQERLGTGHAVMMAREYLEKASGYVLVLAGDTPLITGSTLKSMVKYCIDGRYNAVLLSAILEEATGYGRIIRNSEGDFEKIVEHKDATEAERQIKEINASMYCFEISCLLDALDKIRNDNVQGEYYLTDVLGILKEESMKVGVYTVEDAREVAGINTRIQLAQAMKVMRERTNNALMENGVTLVDPEHTYIAPGVVIGRDTVVYPGNVIEGSTVIGENCILLPNNRIVDSRIGNGVEAQASVILESKIGEKTTVGPYAYIRPGSDIGNRVRIGDFVEVKKSQIGDGSKVSHLTYVGDGSIGNNVNVGCGVVFVNYDGEKKHRTTVGNDAFIGCNVNLVAPVKVEDGAFIAAGSTITNEVPKGSLAIARTRQVNKEGWVEKRKAGKGGGKG
jgi:bifunctional UDP-N-acetylglucosamine pyrophosphorylase/glucosamine-1-phosphate N-acetyltransferase